MRESRKEGRPLRGAFPKTSQDARTSPVSELGSHRAPQFFAVTAKGERVARFKLHTREGQRYSVPYSLLPVFVLSENKVLRIIAHDIEATVFGRGLDVIEDYLSQSELLWLKESPSGKDDELSPVFVGRIDIQLNEE